uniref:Sulfotransferase n=1 Tax=Solanum lycopersicum TaxID=4081 RepID=A0A3Q7IVB1_SOLLC
MEFLLSNPEFVDEKFSLLSTHLPYTLFPKSILESDNYKKISVVTLDKEFYLERVFFFKYEDLKEDMLGCVKKSVDFMDKHFSKEEQSEFEVNKSEKLRETLPGISKSLFFLKEEIDDWKNYLKKDMEKFIDFITLGIFKSLGLTFASLVKY